MLTGMDAPITEPPALTLREIADQLPKLEMACTRCNRRESFYTTPTSSSPSSVPVSPWLTCCASYQPLASGAIPYRGKTPAEHTFPGWSG